MLRGCSGDAPVPSAGLFPATEIPAESQTRAQTSTPLNRPSSTNKRETVQVTPRVSEEVAEQGMAELSPALGTDGQTDTLRQQHPTSSAEVVFATATIRGFTDLLLPGQTSRFAFCSVLQPPAQRRAKRSPVSPEATQLSATGASGATAGNNEAGWLLRVTRFYLPSPSESTLPGQTLKKPTLQ